MINKDFNKNIEIKISPKCPLRNKEKDLSVFNANKYYKLTYLIRSVQVV